MLFCGDLTILLLGLAFHCFVIENRKSLCHSLGRPSRSDFVQLKYVENDGQCLRFLEKALQNKFYELYRSSRKKHDNQFASEMEMIDITVYEENKFIDIIIEEDLKQILKKYKGMKYKIYKDILGGELSDYKIAKKYNITRQYVHRLRKQLYLELRERYFDIKK